MSGVLVRDLLREFVAFGGCWVFGSIKLVTTVTTPHLPLVLGILIGTSLNFLLTIAYLRAFPTFSFRHLQIWSAQDLWLVLLLLPLLEELFYRVLLFGSNPSPFTAVLQGLWFSANHENLTAPFFVLRLSRSLVYATTYGLFGGLAASLSVHLCNNMLSVLAGDRLGVRVRSVRRRPELKCTACGLQLGHSHFQCRTCPHNLTALCSQCRTAHKLQHDLVEESTPSRPAASLPLGPTFAQSMSRALTSFQSEPAIGTFHKDRIVWQSYTGLFIQVNRFAAKLRPEIPHGGFVVLCAAKSPDWYAVDLALLLSGRVVVPLDPDSASSRRGCLAELADRDLWLVCDVAALAWFAGVRTFRGMYVLRTPQDWQHPLATALDKLPTLHQSQTEPGPANQLLSVVFTSGSGGEFKGVMWTSDSLNATLSEPFGAQVILDFLPLHHAFGRKLYLRTLFNGGRFAVSPKGVDLFAALPKVRPTFIGAPPAFWTELWRQAESDRAAQRFPSEAALLHHYRLIFGNRLLAVLSGGAPVPAPVLAFLRLCWSGSVDGYASTEAGTIAVNGTVAQSVDCLLLPAADATLGLQEICIASRMLGAGYLGRAGDPSWITHQGRRYFRTGDAGQRDPDGRIHVVGRLKAVFKLGNGEFVSPEPLELFYEASPLITEVFLSSQVRTQLTGLVVSAAEPSAVRQELNRLALCDNLPHFKIPRVLVQTASFAELGLLTATQKKIRPRLEARLQELLASAAAAASPGALILVGPLVEEVLGQPADPTLGLVDQGFTSLSLITLQRLLQSRLAVELNIPTLFHFGSVQTLEDFIAAQLAGHRPTRPTAAIDWTEELNISSLIESVRALPPALPFDPAGPHCILLTGATGFLGPFLAAELRQRHPAARLLLLVRPPNAAARFARVTADFELPPLLDLERVEVIEGDVALDRFGLTEDRYGLLCRQVTLVVHNAAQVHGLLPFGRLRGHNVAGTDRVLRLCSSHSRKALCLISSVNVLRLGNQVEAPVDIPTDLNSMPGYAQTKYVAEKRCEAFSRLVGLPLDLARVATASGHSTTGRSNPNCFTGQTLAGLIQLGGFPTDGGPLPERLLLTPVDHVARCVAVIVERRLLEPAAPTAYYHLCTDRALPWPELVRSVRLCGYPFAAFDSETWQRALQTLPSTSPLLPFRDSLMQTSIMHIRPPSVQSTYARLGIPCPPVTPPLVGLYLKDLVRLGLLSPAPEVAPDPPADPYFFESWHPGLAHVSFPAALMPLHSADLELLLELHGLARKELVRRAGPSAPPTTPDCPSPNQIETASFQLRPAGLAADSGRVSWSWAFRPSQGAEQPLTRAQLLELALPPTRDLATALQSRIEALAKGLNSEHYFVRLSTRSPKDFAAAPSSFTELRAARLRLRSAGWEVLAQSDRVAEDCRTALALLPPSTQLPGPGRPSPPLHLVLRPWFDLPHELEFRCFVAAGRLCAASAYFPWPTPLSQPSLGLELVAFVTPLLRLLPLNCTVDVVKLPNGWRVIELNRPPPHADPLLFAGDEPVLTQGPFELRTPPGS